MSTITQISPDKFAIQDYTFSDYDIVPNFEITSIFEPSEGVVEYFIYDANSNLLLGNYNFPGYSFTEDPSITNLGGFSTINIDPENDLINTGYDVGQYNVVYNFFENQLNSNSTTQFFISELSTDRTEIKLDSNVISGFLEAFPSFKESLESEDYFNEFYLNFGNNQIVIATNAVIYEGELLIKLYEPLPPSFGLKSTCWVTLKIADPTAYNVNLIAPVEEIDSVPFLKGPNTNLQVKSEINNSTSFGSLDEITSTDLTSSFQQVSSLLTENGININVDYTDYNNFIHFSSAEQRLLNFYTKVSQIEANTNDLINFDFQITGSTSSSLYISESKAASQQNIDNIIKNFDGYEYFLYYESSSYAWPKQNSEPPFKLYSTGSTQVLNWIGNSVEGTTIPNNIFPYGPYGGMALSASRYDVDNVNNLLYVLPEFILDDSQNEPYQLFIEMLGQHFDNIWVYLKDVTNKYDADNRLNFGISKDLVSQAVRDFGLKIYQNQFSTNDLYSAFLGITPSGSLLPYTGSELITSYVTASSAVTPLNDVNKSIYKRLYHNLPYLLNKKGTTQGVKGLIASYGIPNTVLRVSEFGGKDRDNSNDWDYWYNKFNYSFYTSGSNFVSSDFEVNATWGSNNRRPSAVEFRFKSDGVPTEHFTQSLWSTDNGIALNLEYENSGLTSGSYSGSIVSTYKDYGYLRLYPDPADLTVSASVYLPLFDDGWWSVLINSGSTGYDLYAKNKIYIGDDSSYIGFQASSSIQEVNTLWANAATSTFASGSNEYFSGSLQEIRYYKESLNESVFDDYVQNPLSIEGNTLNSSPLELIFRAPLGSELDLESLESVHPKITGSWTVTQSFQSGDSDFAYNSTPIFVPNTEYIFLDQPAVGIKNRITDKVKVGEQILPSGSNQVLSKYRSIEQQLPISQSFTPNINSVEVAFSPQNEINDDIIEQIGYFNLGEKIGDNRYNFYTRSTNSDLYQFTANSNKPYRTDYEDLTKFSREYFEKYTSNYNAHDYIRLIKYFDNSLFKMIKDFVPAKSSLSSGVVIKQHLLERSRYPQPTVNPTSKLARIQGTGSADNTMIDYNVKNLGLTSSISIGSISGGTGGGPNIYNQLANNPYEQSIGTTLPLNNPVSNLTQSYNESIDTVAGVFEITDSTQDEFYNGEYSGSEFEVTNGELSPGCFVYLHGLPTTTQFSASVFNTTASYITPSRFEDASNTPMIDGYAYFLGSDTNTSRVRISKTDGDGNYIGNGLASLVSISTISELGSKTYTFAGGPVDLGTDYLYTVGNTQTQPTYTGNNIIDISFGLDGDNGQYLLPTNDTLHLVNSGAYSGEYFYSFNSIDYPFTVNITDKNPFFSSGSIFDTGSGEMLVHYSNDDLFDVAAGVGGNNFTATDVSTDGWEGDIMIALLLHNRNSGEKIILWESTRQTITPSNTNITSTFTTTAAYNTNLPASGEVTGDIDYYLGFTTSSVTVDPGTNNFDFSRGFQFSISQSQAGLENKGSTSLILESSSPADFINSDCDVLQGNAVDDRIGTLYYDVDYSTNQQTAVNSTAILSGTALKAQVQNSNYTMLGQINPRYNGSRTTSDAFNIWTSASSNTFGKLPTVSREKTYFAYFDFINGTAPELNDKSIAHIQFLVDQDGNTIPPDESKLYITQNSFQTGETVLVNLDDPLRFETPMNELNGSKTVIRGGARVDTLLYSDSGSSFSEQIQFNTGSFSVNNYQFGALNTVLFLAPSSGTYTLYDWNTTTLDNAGQWNIGTDTFTFTSDTNTPVKFENNIQINASGGTSGYFEAVLVKNWTSGPPSSGQILDQFYQFFAGFGGTLNINLNSGFQDFNNGDTIKLIYSTNYTGGTITVNYSSNDSFTSTNQINPEGVINSSYWHVTASTDIWLTGSAELSAIYGAKQYQTWEQSSDLNPNNPEFDPIIQNFTVQVGDEIRFNGAEPYTRMVSDVILPNVDPEGLLRVKLDHSMSLASTPDHFLLRRYIDDASYVLIDTQKPGGSTSPGTIRSKYVTSTLENNFASSVSNIIKTTNGN